MVICERLLGGCGHISPLNNWRKKIDNFCQDPVIVAGKQVKVFSYYCPNCGKKHYERLPFQENKENWEKTYENLFK